MVGRQQEVIFWLTFLFYGKHVINRGKRTYIWNKLLIKKKWNWIVFQTHSLSPNLLKIPYSRLGGVTSPAAGGHKLVLTTVMAFLLPSWKWHFNIKNTFIWINKAYIKMILPKTERIFRLVTSFVRWMVDRLQPKKSERHFYWYVTVSFETHFCQTVMHLRRVHNTNLL